MSYRLDPEDVLQIRVRNSNWNTVPIGSFMSFRDVTGPYRVLRYNLYPAAELDGTPAPGYSQGHAIQTMQQLAAETLPGGLTYEWTTSQQMKTRRNDIEHDLREPDFASAIRSRRARSATDIECEYASVMRCGFQRKAAGRAAA
jgi:hypothetical protein